MNLPVKNQLDPTVGSKVVVSFSDIWIVGAGLNGCDHTSTNAPDPIRTPKLNVLGRE